MTTVAKRRAFGLLSVLICCAAGSGCGPKAGGTAPKAGDAPTGGRDPRITWDNFDKVRHGMTEAEVGGLLGPGREIPRSDTPGLAGDRHRIYGDIRVNHAIIVGFTDSRVVGKTGVLTDADGQLRSKDG